GAVADQGSGLRYPAPAPSRRAGAVRHQLAAHLGGEVMTRKPPRHATRPEPEDTPGVPPPAGITGTEGGGLDVPLAGTDVPPPEGKAWTRSTFGALLDVLTRGRAITVRIEVHESDGSVFTDVIRARRRTAPEPPDTEAKTDDERETQVTSRSKRRRDLVE